MRVNVLPNTMIFEGVLDENTSLTDIMDAFTKLKNAGAKAPITLDFSKVVRANSSGILIWLKFLKATNFQFKYVNAPVWLVGQFNMISGYFESGSFVESFQAPYFAPKSQASQHFKIIIGNEIKLQQAYSDSDLPKRVVNGEEYEIDFDPQQYFHFIVENYNNFKGVKAS